MQLRPTIKISILDNKHHRVKAPTTCHKKWRVHWDSQEQTANKETFVSKTAHNV